MASAKELSTLSLVYGPNQKDPTGLFLCLVLHGKVDHNSLFRASQFVVRCSIKEQYKSLNILTLFLICLCSLQCSSPIKRQKYSFINFYSLFDAFFLSYRKQQLSSSAFHWLFGKQKNTVRRLHNSAICLVSPKNCPIGGLESHSVLLIGCPAEKPNRQYVTWNKVCNHNCITKNVTLKLCQRQAWN